MLAKRVNPKTKRLEHCLVSLDGKKVLQYFGKARPSDEEVRKIESRIEHYAMKGKP